MTNKDLAKIIEIIRDGINTTLDNVKKYIESPEKTENNKCVVKVKRRNSEKSDSCELNMVNAAENMRDNADTNKFVKDINDLHREMYRIAKSSAKDNGYMYNILFLTSLENLLNNGIRHAGLQESYRKSMEDSSWVEEFIDKWVEYNTSKNAEYSTEEEKRCDQDCELQKDYVAEYDKLHQEFAILRDIASMEPSQCEYVVNAFKKYNVKNGLQVVIDTIKTTPYHNTTGISLHGSVVSIFTNYIFNRAWYDITHDGSSSIKVVLNIKPSDYMGDYDLGALLNETLVFLEQYFDVTTAFPNVTRYKINNTDYVSIDFVIGYSRNSTIVSVRIVIDNAVMSIPMVFCKFLDRISEIERNKSSVK